MSTVSYDVEVIRQEANPICWVASCAMVKGYGTKTSVGVGEFTSGFDPSNSCIANLATNWQQCTDLMRSWGFDLYGVSELAASTDLSADDLAKALGTGPAVLLHLCAGFPYGSQYTPLTSGAHAVVLTGIDTDNNNVTFNNPWGDKDQSAALDVILAKINADKKMGKTLGFWPAKATSDSTSGSGDASVGTSNADGGSDADNAANASASGDASSKAPGEEETQDTPAAPEPATAETETDPA